MGWRDALLCLHTHGWNADDIDEACEAMHDACNDGEYEGVEVSHLTLAQVQSVLKVDLDARVLRSLQEVAVLRGRQSVEAEDLQRALYDIDAFAYDFAGDD